MKVYCNDGKNNRATQSQHAAQSSCPTVAAKTHPTLSTGRKNVLKTQAGFLRQMQRSMRVEKTRLTSDHRLPGSALYTLVLVLRNTFFS